MLASIVRIALLAGLVFGGYKLYPHLKPSLAPLLSNSAVLGAQALDPVIKTANNLLPENLRIPTNKPASDAAPANSSSETNQTNSTNLSNLTNTVIDEVKQKAGQAAQTQIDAVKKETSSAFCVALVENIKKQCGLNN
jgi:hypothetical protein